MNEKTNKSSLMSKQDDQQKQNEKPTEQEKNQSANKHVDESTVRGNMNKTDQIPSASNHDPVKSDNSTAANNQLKEVKKETDIKSKLTSSQFNFSLFDNDTNNQRIILEKLLYELKTLYDEDTVYNALEDEFKLNEKIEKKEFNKFDNIFFYALTGTSVFGENGPFKTLYDKIYKEYGNKDTINKNINRFKNAVEYEQKLEKDRKIFEISKTNEKVKQYLLHLQNEEINLINKNFTISSLESKKSEIIDISKNFINKTKYLGESVPNRKGTYLNLIIESTTKLLGLIEAKKSDTSINDSDIQSVAEFAQNVSRQEIIKQADPETYGPTIDNMKQEMEQMFVEVKKYSEEDEKQSKAEIDAIENVIKIIDSKIQNNYTELASRRQRASQSQIYSSNQESSIDPRISELEKLNIDLSSQKEELSKKLIELKQNTRSLAKNQVLKDQLERLLNLVEEDKGDINFIKYQKVKTFYNRAKSLYQEWRKSNKEIYQQDLEKAIPDGNPLERGYLPYINVSKLEQTELLVLKQKENELFRLKREAKKKAREIEMNQKCRNPLQQLGKYISPEFDIEVFTVLEKQIQSSRDSIDNIEESMMNDLIKGFEMVNDDMKISRSNFKSSFYVLEVENVLKDNLKSMLQKIRRHVREYKRLIFHIFTQRLNNSLSYLKRWKNHIELKQQISIYEEDVRRIESKINDMKEMSKVFFTQKYTQQVVEEIDKLNIKQFINTPSVQRELRQDLDKTKELISSVEINQSYTLKDYVTDRKFLIIYLLKFINLGIWIITTQVIRAMFFNTNTRRSLTAAVFFVSGVYFISTMVIFGLINIIGDNLIKVLFLKDGLFNLAIMSIFGLVVTAVIQRPDLFRFTTERSQAMKITWYLMTILCFISTLTPLFLI